MNPINIKTTDTDILIYSRERSDWIKIQDIRWSELVLLLSEVPKLCSEFYLICKDIKGDLKNFIKEHPGFIKKLWSHKIEIVKGHYYDDLVCKNCSLIIDDMFKFSCHEGIIKNIIE